MSEKTEPWWPNAWLSIDDICHRFSLSEEEVLRRQAAGEAFSFTVRHRTETFWPPFQFMAPFAGDFMRRCLEALRESDGTAADGWEVLCFFRNCAEDLGYLSPIEALLGARQFPDQPLMTLAVRGLGLRQVERMEAVIRSAKCFRAART